MLIIIYRPCKSKKNHAFQRFFAAIFSAAALLQWCCNILALPLFFAIREKISVFAPKYRFAYTAETPHAYGRNALLTRPKRRPKNGGRTDTGVEMLCTHSRLAQTTKSDAPSMRRRFYRSYFVERFCAGIVSAVHRRRRDFFLHRSCGCRKDGRRRNHRRGVRC